MEEDFKINTNDDHIIYGTLNSKNQTIENQKNNKLIIFVHGLSGNQHEHQYFNAIDYFTPFGFDTFRFDLYSNADKARQTTEISISIHADDINTVIETFSNKYKELYLIGHSLGCLAIMKSNTKNIKKIIHWDPSAGINNLKDKNITYNKQTKLYTRHMGLEILFSEKLITEFKQAYNLKEFAKNVTKNSQFIFAELAKKYVHWNEHIKDFNSYTIKNADHRFTKENNLKQLYDKTLEYLNN